MDQALKDHIEYLLCVKFDSIRSISGGDISKAYLLETPSERFFCKVNRKQTAFAMFEAEKNGLIAIAETHTIATPQILLCEKLEVGALLLMEYIEPKQATYREMEQLGHALAALHKTYADDFGWDINNFIGSLPQSNSRHSDWAGYYVSERLIPQLQSATDARLLSLDEIPSEEQLLKTCQRIFPKVTPSLLHGDLWNGNYLIDTKGTPYLIDPATYCGHYEVDMAMTRLFGGFSGSFYDAHAEHFPEIGETIERNEIYQLYYLLVHLNLFGRSYHNTVLSILKRYF